MDEFVPIRPLTAISCAALLVWVDGRRQRYGYTRRPRQIRAITEELSRAGKRHGNNRRAGRHCCFEGAKLKRANTFLWSKSSLGKNKDRFAAPQHFLYLVRLAEARIRVGAIERKMVHLPQKCADERHAKHFHLGRWT